MERFEVLLIAPNGIRNANPFGVNDISVSEKLDPETIFYIEKKLTGSLTFRQEDFHHLYEWEQSERRCEKTTLILSENCTTKKEILRIVLAPDEIEWQVDKCFCIVKIDTVYEKYSRYEELKDEEYNLFDLVPVRLQWHIQPEDPVDPIFYQVENAILVYDAIYALINKVYGGIILRSSFFGWGEPQGTIIGNSDKLTKLIFAQNSDIYRRQYHIFDPPTTPATIMKITIDKAIKALCYMFNMKCVLEENNIFRMEHISYYETVTGIVENAMTGESLQYNKAKTLSYKYSKDERYSIETFKSNDKSGFKEFIGLPIEYDVCNSKVSLANKMEIVLNMDYDGSIGDEDKWKGIYIGALNPANDCLYELPHIFDEVFLDRWNNLLGWPYLAQDYHKSNKSFARAKINDEWVTVDTKRYRFQEGVKIAHCCNDYSIINSTVITDLGEGRVMSSKKQLGKPYIEADVYFHDFVTTEVGGPIATDDEYLTTSDETFDNVFLGFPSLLDNDTDATSVYAETRSTSGGGTVTIFTDGNFIYNPKPGFDGFDYFDYYAMDSAGRVDTATVKMIVRIPIVYVRKIAKVVLDSGAHTVVDSSNVAYFRDEDGLYKYDTTGMKLVIYIEGQNYFGTTVTTYEFEASGSEEIIPDDGGSTAPSNFNKIFEPGYGYLLIV